MHQRSTWKWCQLITHQNYVDQGTSKLHQFFIHRNYIEESSLKRYRFFANRNYVKKSMSNRRWIFAHRNHVEESTSKRPVNSSKFSFQCIDVISAWNQQNFDVLCLLGEHWVTMSPTTLFDDWSRNEYVRYLVLGPGPSHLLSPLMQQLFSFLLRFIICPVHLTMPYLQDQKGIYLECDQKPILIQMEQLPT